jgi:integrase/recombinase XerD
MSIGKQSKVLTDKQVEVMISYLTNRRNGLRNKVIFLLSVKSGLRSKEISGLRWSMVVGPDGEIGETINLTNEVSKGKSGRVIPLNRILKRSLHDLLMEHRELPGFDVRTGNVIRTERQDHTSPQSVVNMFHRWYREVGFVGCSSHSGRRTFITNTSRKIGLVGGSLRDVQVMVGHKNLQTTQRYIDYDTECQRRVVDLV